MNLWKTFCQRSERENIDFISTLLLFGHVMNIRRFWNARWRKKSYKKRKFQHIQNPTKRTTLHISLLIASADGLIECFFSSRRRTAFTNQQSWFIKTTIFFSLTNSICSSIDNHRIFSETIFFNVFSRVSWIKLIHQHKIK